MSDSIDFGNLTPQQMLSEVNKAIYSVMVGGQSYKIGSRSLTRADLNSLRSLKTELAAEVESSGNENLVSGAYVAFFDGR